MTTINASVFAGLTGANSVLIARAVGLINDQRLTSLEPLRQELSKGSWTIRVATAADKMEGNPAIFIDPEKDGQNNVIKRGQIVLRLEDLRSASDPSVLKLIDNLNHEGAGHGNDARTDSREEARNALINAQSGLSVTAPGDRYINAMLDDETNARYQSWKFRTELNGLNTEYTASNRASLATDEIYKEFARLEGVSNGLGLTGTAKSTYIVEHARDTMAAYDNHYYPTTSAKYVIDALHIKDAPAGADYLLHVKQTYNATGYEVADPIMHDDGSSSASILYEDGHRIEVIFDSSGNLYQRAETLASGDQTTTQYFANGQTRQVTDTDGAGNNADYDVRTTAYDAQGRMDWSDLLRDDGTRDWTDYDQNSTQPWSRAESHFDAQGREDYATAFIDDGSWSFYDYDQTAARGDRTWQTRFDAQGRTDWTHVIQDDGSVDITDYDQTNVRADSMSQTHVDAQGRTDWTYVTEDDGAHTWTDYDQTGARGDSIWQNRTDAQGREDWRYVTLDDGGHEWTDFDQAGARADSMVQSRTDAGGRQDWVNVIRDDGSRDWTDYDQDGSQVWSVVASHFDAAGREDFANVYLDDGGRDQHDYDQDGSQSWSAVVSHFDALGREAHANVYRDDGSRDWLDYDQDGSQAWSRVESHFDAWGREDVASMFFDDGHRKRYDYDQDNTQYWNRVEQDFDVFGRETVANIYQDDGGRTLVDYSVTPGYRVVSRFNAQGFKILEEASPWLPGVPLPAPLPPAVGPLAATPFYVPPTAPPLNPFITPAFPFPFQPSPAVPAVDDDPYPNAHVDVEPMQPYEPW